MKTKTLLILCLIPCLLIAQEQGDVAVRAQKMAEELSSEGWKTHAGAPSLYEQLYEVCAFEAWNDSDDPMHTTYTGVGNEEMMCVLDMLNTYALRDIQDWYPEFETSVRNAHPGLISFQLTGKLIYPEAEYNFLSSYYNEKETFLVEMDRKTLKEEYKSDISKLSQMLHSIINPIAKFYRHIKGRREEMIIATFTDEFLAGRRVPVPVFDGYRIVEPDKKTEDPGVHLYAEMKPIKNLNYNVMWMEESMMEKTKESENPMYQSQVMYEGWLVEPRVQIRANAAFYIKE